MFPHVSKQGSSTGAGFSVVIAASAPVGGGGLVHAVTVIQPLQTWTVIRGQDDFVAMSVGLESIVAKITPCPKWDRFEGNINMLQTVRHDLQHWLNTVLMNAHARESQAVRNFLTYAANMIPPEYENLPWAVFDANGQINSSPNQGYQNQPNTGNGNLDDMSMVDMFDAGDEVGPAHNYDSDDEDEYRPSERYKPTDEPVTEEDEMDIAMMADEARIIEGMGTYSQSLGASHMSRFPMLEKETADSNQGQYETMQQLQSGVKLRGAVGRSGIVGVGGIGSAMKEATIGIGGSFSQARLQSPPRLDSFKMIKVIGKGSFGKDQRQLLFARLILISRLTCMVYYRKSFSCS